MTESQEFYGASVQEAASKASQALNTTPDELEFEVLDEGSTGFLGIGARDARIAVRGAISANSGVTEAVPEPADTNIDGTDEDEDVGGLPTATVDEREADTLPESDAATEELLLTADRLATELVALMGLDGTVDAYESGEAIVVEVATAQTGLFIGQKGETIDAVQYLLNVMVYKNRPYVKRITVDSEGYRQRRVEAIQGMAHRMARRAQREKRPLSLPPMSAAERRVVHLFLKENPHVSTSSEGQNEDRRVIIAPS